ncbi:cation transporter [Bacillaceae bacterium Marseille-Q3522]|nr:cation transporter [Bacillaceae bacterium Marseille-Q3522]
MSHAHNHDHHNHTHSHFAEAREGNKQGLIFALLITTGIMFLEFFGGLFTNSLALLSDSGHMMSDAASLLLSFIAIWFAARPPSPKKTFGFYRFEVLAALFNGAALFVIAGFIVWEAIGRFLQPQAVSSSMMLIAVIGLLANIISAWSLMRKADVKNNLNLRSAYLHILGDALGSIGAIFAGIIIFLFDWYVADPVVSIVVALLILKSAYSIIRNSIHILLEGTPADVNQIEVKTALEKMNSVINVHDLHIWTITSGLDSLSCHILVKDDTNCQMVLRQAMDLIKKEFHIEHATIQIETSLTAHQKLQI